MNCMPDGKYDGRVICPATPCAPCWLKKTSTAPKPVPAPRPLLTDDDGEWGEDGRRIAWNALPATVRAERAKQKKPCGECRQAFSRPPGKSDLYWQQRLYCSQRCGAAASNRKRWTTHRAEQKEKVG